MPHYAYIALAENGATLTGESVAASEEALRAELSGRGFLVQQVRPKGAGLGLRARQLAGQKGRSFDEALAHLLGLMRQGWAANEKGLSGSN